MAENIKEKISHYSEILIKNPKSSLFARLADLFRESGNIEKAIEICEKGVRHFPYYITGHLVLGRCYYEQKRSDPAKDEFQRVIQLDRSNLQALKFLAEIFSGQNLKSQAIERYREILKFDPENTTIQSELNSILATLPNNESAAAVQISTGEPVRREPEVPFVTSKPEPYREKEFEEIIIEEGPPAQSISDQTPGTSEKPVTPTPEIQKPTVEKILNKRIPSEDTSLAEPSTVDLSLSDLEKSPNQDKLSAAFIEPSPPPLEKYPAMQTQEIDLTSVLPQDQSPPETPKKKPVLDSPASIISGQDVTDQFNSIFGEEQQPTAWIEQNEDPSILPASPELNFAAESPVLERTPDQSINEIPQPEDQPESFSATTEIFSKNIISTIGQGPLVSGQEVGEKISELFSENPPKDTQEIFVDEEGLPQNLVDKSKDSGIIENFNLAEGPLAFSGEDIHDKLTDLFGIEKEVNEDLEIPNSLPQSSETAPTPILEKPSGLSDTAEFETPDFVQPPADRKSIKTQQQSPPSASKESIISGDDVADQLSSIFDEKEQTQPDHSSSSQRDHQSSPTEESNESGFYSITGANAGQEIDQENLAGLDQIEITENLTEVETVETETFPESAPQRPSPTTADVGTLETDLESNLPETDILPQKKLEPPTPKNQSLKKEAVEEETEFYSLTGEAAGETAVDQSALAGLESVEMSENLSQEDTTSSAKASAHAMEEEPLIGEEIEQVEITQQIGTESNLGSEELNQATPAPPKPSAADDIVTPTLAEIYEKQGLLDKALEVYKNLIKVDPGREDFINKIIDLAGAIERNKQEKTRGIPKRAYRKRTANKPLSHIQIKKTSKSSTPKKPTE